MGKKEGKDRYPWKDGGENQIYIYRKERRGTRTNRYGGKGGKR